jgi:PAS domain S-box-containing protein
MKNDPAKPGRGSGKTPEKKSGHKDRRSKSDGSQHESEERFRKVFENSPIGMALVAPDFRFFAVNPAWISMTGYSEQELLQLSFTDITHPDYLEGDIKHIQELIAGTISVYSSEKQYIRKDKSILWGRLRVTAIRDEKEVCRYLAAQIEDITDRKEAEEALRESESRLRSFIETSQDSVVLIDEEGRVIEWNSGSERISGIPKTEVVGRYIWDITFTMAPQERRTGELLTHLEHVMRSSLSTGVPIFDTSQIVESVHPDGNRFFTSQVIFPIKTKKGFRFGSIARDITLEKKAEAAIRESEEKFRLVVEHAPEAIFIQTEGRFAYVNPAACSLFNIPSSDMLMGTPVPERVHPDFRKKVDEWIQFLNEKCTPISQKEEKILSLHEREIDVEVSAVPVVYQGKNGSLVFITNIAERKRAEAEKESLIAELARKNTELDRFTYTISHDLKSPLIAIRAFLCLLEDDLKSGDSSQAGSDIRQISESAKKLESLINTLLSLSRSGRTVSIPLPVHLHEIVHTAAGLLGVVIQERGIDLVVDANLPVVMGDRERLLQVMTNLIDNAVKFMGDQKQPEIEVGMQQENGGTVLFVRDNGMGIQKENLSRIFSLYEQLNPDIPGTGIGLATVKRIIEAHGGRIWAESDGHGKGTTFRFTLPGATDPPGKPG